MSGDTYIDQHGNKWCGCGEEISNEEDKCYLCRLLENWPSNKKPQHEDVRD